MNTNIPFEISVIINNRDLLSWPKAMVNKLRTMKGVKEIIIIDNGSSYRPLMKWYKETPIRVEFLDNIGHTAPWKSGIIDELKTDLYVVTDPDLDIENLPEDTLLIMATHLQRLPQAEKIGLSLQTDDIPAESPYANHVTEHANRIANAIPRNDGLISYPVDTTFAIYDRRILKDYKICGLRMPHPYVARHIPWHVVKPEGEFLYYLDHVEGKSSSYEWFTNHIRSDSVRGLYKHHQGKVSTKWDSYLDIYEEHFRSMKNKQIDFLEIGVQNGGSLDIWSRYFPNANTLTGCDINPRCNLLKYDDPRVKIIIGNANEAETFREINNRSSAFDIIVDDGSHKSHDVLTTFLSYFPRLKPGGLFLIEDMHCAYWEGYGGGIFNNRSPAAFFRNIIDAINQDHFKKDLTPGLLFQSFMSAQKFDAFLDENPIHSMSVYDSVFVIRKASSRHIRGLGTCVVVGEQAIADPRVLPQKK